MKCSLIVYICVALPNSNKLPFHTIFYQSTFTLKTDYFITLFGDKTIWEGRSGFSSLSLKAAPYIPDRYPIGKV
jgi:hypothetical protein